MAHQYEDDPREEAHGDVESAETGSPKREPIFNLPGIVLGFIVLFAAIHIIRAYLLDNETDTLVILLFAFIPILDGPLSSQLPFPNAFLWSPVTHGFLHGDWTHLGVNSIWMAAFGSPVAKRFGAGRFVAFSCICMAAGAFAHYLFYAGQFVPVIGASGAVSAYMGAAGRFAFNNFARNVTGKTGFRHDGPALSLVQSFSNRQFLVFTGVWMIFNYLFGAGVVGVPGQGAGIAWQAHIGGFVAGVLLFSLFDPRKRHLEA